MLFNSPEYGIFLIVVFVLFWVMNSRVRMSHVLLLAASYFFYGCWDARYLALIIYLTLLNYFMGGLIHAESSDRRRRLFLVVSLVGSLGALAIFKYAGFATAELFWFLNAMNVRNPVSIVHILLPVGISFYTFQTLSYTIDLYRREMEPCASIVDFALFVSFFPQLVAGPIVRARQFLPQLKTRKQYSDDMVSEGLYQILKGMVKKMVIADYLGTHLVDGVFSDPTAHGSLTILLAIYAYAFQIYGDFSGYSDIAIGSARMLGFRIPINFNGPYKAQNLREFWQRWHISLSTWLRDYLYIPLGGNRRGNARTYVNLMITMLLGGLWHGAAWTFVLWGFYHGVLLALTRLYQKRFRRAEHARTSRIASALKILGTFHLVCFGWIIFRVDMLVWMKILLTRFLQSGDWSLAVPANVLFVLALAAVSHFMPSGFDRRFEKGFVRMPAVAQGLALALAIGLFNLLQSAANPFIYFQF